METVSHIHGYDITQSKPSDPLQGIFKHATTSEGSGTVFSHQVFCWIILLVYSGSLLKVPSALKLLTAFWDSVVGEYALRLLVSRTHWHWGHLVFRSHKLAVAGANPTQGCQSQQYHVWCRWRLREHGQAYWFEYGEGHQISTCADDWGGLEDSESNTSGVLRGWTCWQNQSPGNTYVLICQGPKVAISTSQSSWCYGWSWIILIHLVPCPLHLQPRSRDSSQWQWYPTFAATLGQVRCHGLCWIQGFFHTDWAKVHLSIT